MTALHHSDFKKDLPPPKIGSILTSLTSGGAEILVTNLNTHFAPQGIDAVVLALCDAHALGNSAAMESELRGRLDQAGCRFMSLALPPRRGFWEGARALRRWLRDETPDLVHVHTVRGVLMLALAGCRLPIVFTHHNSKLSFPPWLFRVLDRFVDDYVAISNDTAALYRRYSRRPFVLIPNAPAPDFRAATPRDACAVPVQILTVGAVSDQKHYGLLIETARMLRSMKSASPPAAMFKIAGGGAGLEALRAQVRELGLADRVEFLGERSDISALIAQSDIYLNTSRYEGFSIAILEALSGGLPVVATDVPGNRGLVTPGQNGYLAPLDRPSTLAAAIGRIASDPALYRKLSAGAMRSARDYTIEGAARRHLELYASLMGRPGTRKD